MARRTGKSKGRPNPVTDRFRPPPSPWIQCYAWCLPNTGSVLDLACGSGRHSRYLLDLGHRVTALDRDLSGIADLDGTPGLTLLQADLEDGSPFPLAGQSFDGVLVANYLYRPLLPALLDAVAPGGGFLYETFALGNERFGKPRNPDYLLHPGELLETLQGRLRILAYEDLVVSEPRPAAVQRVAARRE